MCSGRNSFTTGTGVETDGDFLSQPLQLLLDKSCGRSLRIKAEDDDRIVHMLAIEVANPGQGLCYRDVGPGAKKEPESDAWRLLTHIQSKEGLPDIVISLAGWADGTPGCGYLVEVLANYTYNPTFVTGARSLYIPMVWVPPTIITIEGSFARGGDTMLDVAMQGFLDARAIDDMLSWDRAGNLCFESASVALRPRISTLVTLPKCDIRILSGRIWLVTDRPAGIQLTRYLFLYSIMALSGCPKGAKTEMPKLAQCSLEGEWLPNGEVPFSKVDAYYESGMDELCFRHDGQVNMLLISETELDPGAGFAVRLQTDPDLLRNVDVIPGPNTAPTMGEPAPPPPACPRALPPTSMSSGVLSATRDPLTYSCRFADNCDSLACTATYYQRDRVVGFSMGRLGTSEVKVVEKVSDGLPDCFVPHDNFKNVGVMRTLATSNPLLTDGQMIVDADEYRKIIGENTDACVADFNWERNRLWMIEGREGFETEVSIATLMGQYAMMVYEKEVCEGDAKPRERFGVALPAGGMSVHVEHRPKLCDDSTVP